MSKVPPICSMCLIIPCVCGKGGCVSSPPCLWGCSQPFRCLEASGAQCLDLGSPVRQLVEAFDVEHRAIPRKAARPDFSASVLGLLQLPHPNPQSVGHYCHKRKRDHLAGWIDFEQPEPNLSQPTHSHGVTQFESNAQPRLEPHTWPINPNS